MNSSAEVDAGDAGDAGAALLVEGGPTLLVASLLLPLAAALPAALGAANSRRRVCFLFKSAHPAHFSAAAPWQRRSTAKALTPLALAARRATAATSDRRRSTSAAVDRTDAF